MVRPVLQYPDPRLTRKSEPVDAITEEIRQLGQDLIDTVTSIGGVGIAAPQIGVSKRVIVIDPAQALQDPAAPQRFTVLVNPRITVLDPEKHQENDGCLSVPDYRAPVSRPRRVAMDATGLDGKPVHLEGEGYYGASLQHETDHLDGILFLDRISYLRRSRYARKIRKAEAAS
jgi:peptide deformylase